METFSRKKNINLSSLTKTQLEEFKKELQDFYLEYRRSLTIPKNIQFGVEIEYDNLEKFVVDDFVAQNYCAWKSVEEASLENGGEVVSPILLNNNRAWNDIKDICTFLKTGKAEASPMTGAHVHVCANVIGNNIKGWENLAKLIMAYENILFRYSAGEDTIVRKIHEGTAYLIAFGLYGKYLKSVEGITKENFKKFIGDNRFQGISVHNVMENSLNNTLHKNTVEFRFPNGTFNEIIWQNNINTFVHFLLACNKELDEEYIKYRFKLLNSHLTYDYYHGLDEEGALHLADLLFDNELDKAYFLRQYYKDFTHIDFNTEMHKTGSFTKTLC